MTIVSDAAAILGRLGGKVGGKSKSSAKVKASRVNGALGGRPRSENPSPAALARRKRRAAGKS